MAGKDCRKSSGQLNGSIHGKNTEASSESRMNANLRPEMKLDKITNTNAFKLFGNELEFSIFIANLDNMRENLALGYRAVSG